MKIAFQRCMIRLCRPLPSIKVRTFQNAYSGVQDGRPCVEFMAGTLLRTCQLLCVTSRPLVSKGNCQNKELHENGRAMVIFLSSPKMALKM